MHVTLINPQDNHNQPRLAVSMTRKLYIYYTCIYIPFMLFFSTVTDEDGLRLSETLNFAGK